MSMLRFHYIPWIEGHTGALVRLIEQGCGARAIPVDLIGGITGRRRGNRSEVMALAEREPDVFQQRMRELMGGIREESHAFLFTVDWCSGLRETARFLRECGVPTVLVPHESVFARSDLYYRDPVTGYDVPSCETALLWGGLQREIFLSRGFPPERMVVVGSPKLDWIRHYRSAIPRDVFLGRLGLRKERPVVLFATQPMDNQFDTGPALLAQSRAIADVLRLCQTEGWQLIVRLPPARDVKILAPGLVHALLNSGGLAALDGCEEGRHLATPEDALAHCDAVVSVNSTMLLEASLMGKPAVSCGYVACEQFWHHRGGLPLACNREELSAALRHAIGKGGASFSEAGWAWVRDAFSPGDFDGQSPARIAGEILHRHPEAVCPAELVAGHATC
jgi:hypothetical protein